MKLSPIHVPVATRSTGGGGDERQGAVVTCQAGHAVAHRHHIGVIVVGAGRTGNGSGGIGRAVVS
jgi:hypothetical protein